MKVCVINVDADARSCESRGQMDCDIYRAYRTYARNMKTKGNTGLPA